ncbi:EndoS/ChiA family endoglycosidase [Arthrobacter sp. KNU-44]|uniref:EndoS/ChiA family endoglycosidase n=1 Tax=Arthrobacter sp. KNU-44 TaxID=3450744 RepID=UPI003F42C4A0
MRRTTAFGAGLLLAGLAAFGPQSAVAAETPKASVGNTTHCEAEPLTMAYYRTWRDVTVPQSANSNLPDPNVTRMSDLPPEIDVAMVFDAGATANTDYWATLRDTYVPALHAQGTKVVHTLWIERLARAKIPLTEDAYRSYAQELVDTFVTPYGLDGIDIDVESHSEGDELTRAIGVFNALGKLIGPKSGTDKLFIFDTNLDGNTPLFKAVHGNISFVLLQAYGRGTWGMQGTWNTFADKIASCQFLPGFSFPEERDLTRWGDAEGIYDPATAPRSKAYQYVTWQPEGGSLKGGFFAYAVDRDGKAWGDDTITPTAFSWMKNLSAVQDKAAGVVPKGTWSLAVASTPAHGSKVGPGDTVAWTVSATAGPVDVPGAVVAVDLTDLVDDATVEGLTASTGTTEQHGGVAGWRTDLPAGKSATLTVSARISAADPGLNAVPAAAEGPVPGRVSVAVAGFAPRAELTACNGCTGISLTVARSGPTPTVTATPSPTATVTPTPTATGTATPTPSATSSVTATGAGINSGAGPGSPLAFTGGLDPFRWLGVGALLAAIGGAMVVWHRRARRS